MNVKEFFGAGIKGLHLGVRNRPGGRDAALVPDHAKIFRAHAEHGGAEHFGLSAHEVRLLRVQFLTVFVLPDFFGVIAVVEKNGGGVPVELFLRHEGPPLKDKNLLAGPREVQRESSAPRSGADDDCVVSYRHADYDSRPAQLNAVVIRGCQDARSRRLALTLVGDGPTDDFCGAGMEIMFP